MDDDAFDAGLAGGVLQPLITHLLHYLRAGRYAPTRSGSACAASRTSRIGLRREVAPSVVNETPGRRVLAGHLAR